MLATSPALATEPTADECNIAQGVARTYAGPLTYDKHCAPLTGVMADRERVGGEDAGTPVSEDYRVRFCFTGVLKKVAIQLTDSVLTAEEEAEIEDESRNRVE
jgi:hypothetical protein